MTVQVLYRCCRCKDNFPEETTVIDVRGYPWCTECFKKALCLNEPVPDLKEKK